MKTYTFEQWHNGYCLYLCTLAVGDYFGKSVALNDKVLGLDATHWTWPATAAVALANTGLFVSVYDTDISYSDFVKDPFGWVMQKYGKAGIDHIESHFNFDMAVDDSKIALSKKNVIFENKSLTFAEIYTQADDTNKVLILCLNYATIFGTDHGRMGHYFLVKGTNNGSLVITEPLHASDVILSKELFRQGDEDLDNEVQHFIIRR